MKKPDILKPRNLYEELSPNIPEEYLCTIVHAYYRDSRFHIISQMFTGGEDEESPDRLYPVRICVKAIEGVDEVSVQQRL